MSLHFLLLYVLLGITKILIFLTLLFCGCSSDDPHKDILALLAQHKEEPESEAQLKLLLPHIVSCFGENRSISKIIEELKKHQESADSGGILFFIWISNEWRIYNFAH